MDSQKIAEYWIELKYKVEQAGLRKAEKELTKAVERQITSNGKLKKSEEDLSKEKKKAIVLQNEHVKSFKYYQQEQKKLDNALKAMDNREKKSLADKQVARRKELESQSRFNRLFISAEKQKQKQIERVAKAVKYYSPPTKTVSRTTPYSQVSMHDAQVSAFREHFAATRQKEKEIAQEEKLARIRENDRRRAEAHQARMQRFNERSLASSSVSQRAPRSPNMMGDVGRPGSLGVAWHTALAGGGILTGFGLRALNQKVQQLQMLPVMMETVTGSAERAQQELAFTKRLSSELGITQLDLTPDYTKLMAATLGTPMEGSTQQGFSNFLRYSKVMGLDQERTKLSLRALTQIANKGTLMSEEVKSQLGEHMPGVIRLLAEELTGGDVGKFFKEMELGKYKSAEVLPKLFDRMGKEAAKGWTQYTQTSGYQQGLAAVGMENQIALFGKTGGEEAFFRIWQEFAKTLPQTDNLVKSLSSAFNGFARGVEGAGSVIRLTNDAYGAFLKLSPEVQHATLVLGSAFLLLGTKMGGAFAPLTAAYLVLEDIASYNEGKKSITGMALGVDYSAKTYQNIPESIRTPITGANTGKFLGASVDAAQRQAVARGDISSKVKLGGLQALSAMGEAIKLPVKGFNYLGNIYENTDVDMSKFQWGKTSILDAFSYRDTSNFARSPLGTLENVYNIDTVNLFPNNNKPEEFSFLLQKQVPTAISE